MPILPPLLVRLEADISNFSSGLSNAERQVQRMAQRGASGFDRLATVGKAAFLGLSAAAVGFGTIAIREALEQEEANARLTVALRNAGTALNATAPAFVRAQAAARQLGFADEEATDSLAKLTNATKDPTKAIQDLALAQNVARGRNIDLAAATDLVVKVETGHVALLGRLGINVKDATGATISQTEALKRLSDLYGGQASAYADTFAGKLAVLKAETSDFAERIGFALIPKIEALIGFGNDTIDWMERNQTAVKALAVLIGGPLVIAMGAYIVKQGIVVSSRLAQVFLDVGAAVRNTTAATIVLGETTAATHRTMILGAGAVAGALGLLALKYLEVQQSQQGARSEADKWVAAQLKGIDAPRERLEAVNKLLDEQKDKTTDGFAAWVGWDNFMGKQTGTATAKDNVASLKDEAERLTAQLDAGKGPAQQYADALGGIGDEAADAVDELGGLFSATTAYMAANERVAADEKALATARGGIAEKIEAQADASRELVRATQDLQAAQTELNKAQREAPLQIADAHNEAAAAATNVAEKTRALTVATERFGAGSLEARRAQDDLTAAQTDSAQAAQKAKDLAASGGRTPDVLDAERGVAAAKERQADASERKLEADRLDPIAAIADAEKRLKDDQLAILFAREKEITAINTFNTQYGTTLRLADLHTGKLTEQLAKMEQMVIDQKLLEGASPLVAGATVPGALTPAQIARREAVLPTGVTTNPTPTGDPSNPFVQKYGPTQNVTVNAVTNADPVEIGREVAFVGRSRVQ